MKRLTKVSIAILGTALAASLSVAVPAASHGDGQPEANKSYCC